MPPRFTPCALLGVTFGLVLFLPGQPVSPGRGPVDSPAPAAHPLHLAWQRDLPPLPPTWPDQPRVQWSAYQPVTGGDLFLLSSSRSDSVTAYEARSGAQRWRFLAGGPVRLAPTVWKDRAYVVSDDGHLYCLEVSTGRALWKFRGAPAGPRGDRLVLGNERLVSTWPARAGPVVTAGPGERPTVYFAAGIWPFMGIFLHALDADTGEVRWSNSGDGSLYIKQPHQADAYAGIAPQGQLVVAGDKLLVPGGRSVPACYDRHTGKLQHYRLADSSKLGGGPEVQVGAGVFVNGPAAFDLASGDYLGPVSEPCLVSGNLLYAARGTELLVHDLSKVVVPTKGSKARTHGSDWLPEPLGKVAIPAGLTCLAREGSALYAGASGRVQCIELSATGLPERVSAEVEVEGTVAHCTTCGGLLLVSTREGKVLAFGPERVTPARHPLPTPPAPAATEEVARQVHELLRVAGTREGYAVVWGAGASPGRSLTGSFALELVRQSELRVVVVEGDPTKRQSVRALALEQGVPAARLAVVGAPGQAQLPPYLSSLSTAAALPDEPPSEEFLQAVFASLRPYGGSAWLPLPSRHVEVVKRWLAADPERRQGRVRVEGRWLVLSREGALPGAGDWTHQHADAGNTRVSRDARVKAPLGLLWFGGPGHQGILPRHGHGPEPQVLDGLLFIEGVDGLRAIDIYTGRLLWETSLPGLGGPYDNMAHQPGANASGTNYVSTREGIYVAWQDGCVVLDPATGKVKGKLTLPRLPAEKLPPSWAFLTVVGDAVVAGYNPIEAQGGGNKKARTLAALSSSKYLAVLNRHTGHFRWTVCATEAFRHNAICAGGGRLYAIDRSSGDHLLRFPRRVINDQARLVAFDLATGKEVWSASRDVFGTWLSYSEDHDVLVESGRLARDTLTDEPRGMRAYRGASGTELWYQKDYIGPAMIHGRQVLKNGDGSASTGSACDLLTGKAVLRDDPLTGKPAEWRWARTYGCNTPLASEHLITFRSGAAGYFDLAGDGGTGNFGGFRSGCTNNLLVAGGLLVAPDYTRTCTCSYQNQASLALVPMPEAEMWTSTGSKSAPTEAVRQVGINLGAPGSRKSPDGVLWVEYPPVGGPSPRLGIRVEPAQPSWFREHSWVVEGDGLAWVSASGARGLLSLTIPLGSTADLQRAYTVRLHFREPDGLGAGQRVFDVALQGQRVLKGLDISREAGGPNRSLVKEFKGVTVTTELAVALTPDPACAVRQPVLCGVEVRAEGW